MKTKLEVLEAAAKRNAAFPRSPEAYSRAIEKLSIARRLVERLAANRAHLVDLRVQVAKLRASHAPAWEIEDAKNALIMYSTMVRDGETWSAAA